MKAIGTTKSFNPTSNLNDLIRRTQQASTVDAGLKHATADTPAITGGAFQVLELDLANPGVGITPKLDVPGGYGFYYLVEGSDAGGRVNVRGAGEWTSMAPGDYFEGHFSDLKVYRGDTSATSGKARFLVVFAQGFAGGTLRETVAGGSLAGAVVGPGGAATQAVNSAAGNIPTDALDGISIVGGGKVKVVLSAESTRTLSGGGILRYWHYNASSFPSGTPRARWALLYGKQFELDSTLHAGIRDLEFDTETIGVKEGRLYAEAKSVTASGGTTLVVTMERY